jgi:hypothetical protein
MATATLPSSSSSPTPASAPAPPPPPPSSRPEHPLLRPKPTPTAAETAAAHLAAIRAALDPDGGGAFSRGPPHTLQRLAELVLRPREHYRHLPPFLAALVRVVSVSSTAAAFPLPGQIAAPAPAPGVLGAATAGAAAAPLVNGGGAGADGEAGAEGLGVDRRAEEDSLGGARLTPIPWLLRRVSATPSSSPEMPPRRLLPRDQVAVAAAAVSVAGVNGIDGAGPAVGPHGPQLVLNGANGTNGALSSSVTVNGNAAALSADGDDEIPHARGPPEIGVEDTGPLTGTGGVASLGGGGEAADETAMEEGEG